MLYVTDIICLLHPGYKGGWNPYAVLLSTDATMLQFSQMWAWYHRDITSFIDTKFSLKLEGECHIRLYKISNLLYGCVCALVVWVATYYRLQLPKDLCISTSPFWVTLEVFNQDLGLEIWREICTFQFCLNESAEKIVFCTWERVAQIPVQLLALSHNIMASKQLEISCTNPIFIAWVR